MLDWVSESGTGSWDAFKETHGWMQRAGLWNLRAGPSWTARTLATLGHLEVDWLNRRWAVAPTVLTILPDAGAHALICGSRTRYFRSRLVHVAEGHQDIWLHECPQPSGPQAWFIQIASEEVAQSLADELEIRFDYSIASRIAHNLPSLDSYLSIAAALPAPSHEEAEQFDVGQLRWQPALRTDIPGAYKYKVYGRPEYRYISTAGAIYRLDQDLSVYAALRDVARSVLRWEPDTVNGTLVVEQGAALPLLHARVAAMCTGLVPKYDVQEHCHRYVNVPASLAEMIATSLGQELHRVEPRQLLSPRVRGAVNRRRDA